MKFKKGQGVLEYLILLSIVIVASSTLATLLSFFPGTSMDSKIAQSQAYWQGVASPFAVEEHAISAQDGKFYIVVQNQGAEGLQISKMDFFENGINFTYSPPQGYFGASDKRTFSMNLPEGICRSSNTYELQLNITYSTADISNKVEHGSASLIGTCSTYSAGNSGSSPGSLGSSCSNPNDCDSHHCYGGVCVQCIGNGHCPIGQACSLGACVSCEVAHCG